MGKNKTYKSKLSAAIHETVSDMYEAGAIDKATMRRFDKSCLAPTAIEKSISSKRLEFLKENQKLYANKYLAFDQDKLICVSSTFREAKESAIGCGVTKPFVIHVPDPGIVYFVGW